MQVGLADFEVPEGDRPGEPILGSSAIARKSSGRSNSLGSSQQAWSV
jgi:hypothetical protein